MPPAGYPCYRAALPPSPSLPAPTHHLRHALGSPPLAPCLALLGPLPLVSAAACAALARLPLADCNCPRRQRLAAKPACASGWRLAPRQSRLIGGCFGNGRKVRVADQSSVHAQQSKSLASTISFVLIRQRLRASRPTPAFSGAAN